MRKHIIIISILLMDFFGTNNVLANNTLINNESKKLDYNILDTIITGAFTLLGVFIGFIGLYINNKLENSRKKEEQISNILLEKYNELIILLNRMSEKKNSIKYFAYNRIAMEYYQTPNSEECRQSLETGYGELVEMENVFYDIEVYIQNNKFIIEEKITYKNFNKLYNIITKERDNTFFRLMKGSLQLGKTFTKEKLINAEQKYIYYINKIHELIIELKETMECKIF